MVNNSIVGLSYNKVTISIQNEYNDAVEISCGIN
jgi:hypothetical protein